MEVELNDGVAGSRNDTYEARLCMFFAVRSYMRKLKDFKLRHQVPEAGKFNVIVFDEGGEKYQVFEVKHKENVNLKITHAHLFNENFSKDFNLLKFVRSFIEINSTGPFANNISAAVLFTNLNFDQNDGKISPETNQLVPVTLDANAIFHTSYIFPDAKYYKFSSVPNIDQVLKTALQFIIYAVNQPNDKEIEEIIKSEIRGHFKLRNVDLDTIYNAVEKLFRKWCETKEPLLVPTSNLPSHESPNVIMFKDVEEIFQQNVKKVSFGVTTPISSFTGRRKELDTIKEELQKEHNVIVSQAVAIRGLGGIGKTDLTKQFIKEFGQSDFYGRVIWIEAESDASVKSSFILLAHKLEIQEITGKSIKDLIDEVFEFFEELKVLFVFDNFDKAPASDEENFVVYCCNSTSKSTKEHRPYFIFTSRNRQCLPDVLSLDLSVLIEQDARNLINNELVNIESLQKDVDELAETLQYFPLALQQAIAYIQEQHIKKSILGKRYEIQDYLKEFEKQKEKLLDYQYTDDFGVYEKTTFITWNVTFNAIEADEKNGANATQVLKFLAYFHADRIDPKLYLSLFENDSTCNERAFLTLEKYSMITKIDRRSSFYQIHRLVQAVVQFKFKENEEEILEQAIKLINPIFYEYYFKETTESWNKFMLEKECTLEKLLLFNHIEIYTKKHESMDKKFSDFFKKFRNRVLVNIIIRDDIDNILALNFSEKDLKEFIKKNVKKLMELQCNNVITYFVEKEILELNELSSDDNSKSKSLIEISADTLNLYILKFLIEKGADFTEVLEFASVELISDIINGRSRSDLVQTVINDKSESNRKILEEALCFAALFDQEAIVNLVINNDVEPDFKLGCRLAIFAAARFNYTNILQSLLQKCNKDDLKYALFSLSFDRHFDNKDIYEECFNRYRQLGGNINDEDNDEKTFLSATTDILPRNIAKSEIFQFLLDNGADPTLTNNKGGNAFIFIIYYFLYGFSDMDEIYNKIISLPMSPEKFITVVTKILFKVTDWSRYDRSNLIFDDLVKKIGDINVTNDKGETLLINYVQDDECEIENVKFLLENGADVDIKDNNGKTAVNYALELKKDKVSSVFEQILIEGVQLNKLLIE